jgi:GTPase SAR1 family protein
LDIPLTNIIMFGPQGTGKTAITERILGFPVGVVSTEFGTTRPMVLTTRKAETIEYKVKGAKDRHFQFKKKSEIMPWVMGQMADTGMASSSRSIISKERIYVEVSGPACMNRRFIDLPGFEYYDANGRASRQDILDLIEKEMTNPNTMVVCVEDSRVEYVNSNLVRAMKEVFGQDFASRPDMAGRFVLAFTKSDLWFSDGEVTKSTFVSRLSSYAEGCGLVPILVGTSVCRLDESLGQDRANGTADFSRMVKDYQHADSRERTLYFEWLSTLSLGKGLEECECLVNKFHGFDNLRRTVDAMVVTRDVANVKLITQKLVLERDAVEQQIVCLRRRLQALCGDDGKTTLSESKKVIKTVLQYLSELATNEWGSASAIAAMAAGEIEHHGNDALMEEMEFFFGARHEKSPPSSNTENPFKGYYNPERAYPVSSSSTVVILPSDTKTNWQREISEMIKKLKTKQESGSISYLDRRLVNGQLYERALALWSSSVYRLLAPSKEDLTHRLPNIMGFDPELRDPTERSDFKKARRFAETFIHRLNPAIHYLCQKMEFLLLKNFDTAWRVLLRVDESKTFLNAVGGEEFKTEVRLKFEQAVRKRAEIAYDRCSTDLHREVQKLLPYSDQCAAATGMAFAYPEAARIVIKTQENYRSIIKEHLAKIQFVEGLSVSFQKGIEEGIRTVSNYGSIDPLFFSGLEIAKCALNPVIAHNFKRVSGQDKVLREDQDERTLGFVACLYAHFLPRFIATVDSRMRSDIWGCVKDAGLVGELESHMEDSETIKSTKVKTEKIRHKGRALQERKMHINKILTDLMGIVEIIPSTPHPVCTEGDAGSCDEEYGNNHEGGVSVAGPGEEMYGKQEAEPDYGYNEPHQVTTAKALPTRTRTRTSGTRTRARRRYSMM